MFGEPNCFTRKCKHFIGVADIGGEDEEIYQVLVCKAFPEGIPEEILFGDNLHTTIHKDQTNKIIYEKEE